MLEIISGAVIGIGTGIALGKYSCQKIIFPKAPPRGKEGGLNYLKYNKRCNYIKGFSEEIRALITNFIFILEKINTINVSVQLNECLSPYFNSIDSSLYKIKTYYEPMQKIYLADTGLEKFTKKINRSIKKISSSLNMLKEEGTDKDLLSNEIKSVLQPLIGYYSGFSDTITDTKTLLWL
ncbi:hypothetical protein JXB41_04355 [Candidatus Woesearchaeota archaeon]|nr:hypothetical protein [Candidatus Woesearchaeota archaeon]